jgi:hypothetical protein
MIRHDPEIIKGVPEVTPVRFPAPDARPGLLRMPDWARMSAKETLMKTFLISLGLAVAVISPAQALCVSERDVAGTESKDGKNLIFRMRDGRTLVNHLKGTCNDLRFNGFVWVLRGNNDICENVQSLRVLQSGQVCVLGAFEEVKKTPPKAP